MPIFRQKNNKRVVQIHKFFCLFIAAWTIFQAINASIRLLSWTSIIDKYLVKVKEKLILFQISRDFTDSKIQ